MFRIDKRKLFISHPSVFHGNGWIYLKRIDIEFGRIYSFRYIRCDTSCIVLLFVFIQNQNCFQLFRQRFTSIPEKYPYNIKKALHNYSKLGALFYSLPLFCFNFQMMYACIETSEHSFGMRYPIQKNKTNTMSPGAMAACVTRSPFYKHGLTLIPAWISNRMHSQVWDEITYPSQNFDAALF